MRLRSIPILTLLFLSFSFSSVLQVKTVKDALGYSILLSSPPQRIVSLAPNITEILFALGLKERIVGVTRYCDYPPQALEKEKIGGMVDLNLEKIHALNPDLVIGFRGNPLSVLKRLRELDLPLFVLEMGSGLESVFEIIKKIGAVTQQEKEAENLIESMQKKYSHMQDSLQKVQYQPKVFFSLHGMGLWTCGKGSFLDDLARKAKGINIAGNIQRKWLHYNREELIHENPDVIIILAQSKEEFQQALHWMKGEKPFREIRAVSEDRIHFLDANIATRPGPRLVDALVQLAHILHPSHFKKEQ
jgi:iron complex transport system substrate-binding protein